MIHTHPAAQPSHSCYSTLFLPLKFYLFGPIIWGKCGRGASRTGLSMLGGWNNRIIIFKQCLQLSLIIIRYKLNRQHLSSCIKNCLCTCTDYILHHNTCCENVIHALISYPFCLMCCTEFILTWDLINWLCQLCSRLHHATHCGYFCIITCELHYLCDLRQTNKSQFNLCLAHKHRGGATFSSRLLWILRAEILLII